MKMSLFLQNNIFIFLRTPRFYMAILLCTKNESLVQYIQYDKNIERVYFRS